MYILVRASVPYYVTYSAQPPNMAKVLCDKGAPAWSRLAWGLNGSYWFNPPPLDTSVHCPVCA